MKPPTRKRVAVLLAALAVLGLCVGLGLSIWRRPDAKSPEHFVPPVWQNARDTPMHQRHVEEKKIACSTCHAGGAEGDAGFPGPPPAEAVCATCHAKEVEHHHHGKGASTTTCVQCHVFGAHKTEARCDDCHAATMRAVEAPRLDHHAKSGTACSACHAMHGTSRALVTDCTGCHVGKSAVHGRLEAHGAPVEAGKPPAADPLLEPLALGALRDAAVAFAADATLLPSDPRAASTGQMCTACHAPHSGGAAARETCARCHTTTTTGQGVAAPPITPHGPRVAGHQACVTCHDPHRARRVDVRECAGCHRERQPALAVAGHATCTGCHAPHAPSFAAKSCAASCHANVGTLAATKVQPHDACTSCHDPHRPEASPGLSCVKCHASLRATHPPAPNGAHGEGRGPCVGCHAPHGPAPKAKGHPAVAVAIAQPCASCHASIPDKAHPAFVTNGADRAHRRSAGLECTKCHAPHAFGLAGRGAALCADCHGAIATKTTALAGHADCSACHGGPHAPTTKPACASCHAAETATAPRGHAACTSCHDPHSGSRGPSFACASCHEPKTKSLHGHTPKGCTSCHRAHGPAGPEKPPECASCHERSSLSGLHLAGSHTACRDCHSGHGPPRSDRAACTSTCHTDRRSHQPEAQSCRGCHLFRR